MLVHWMLEKCRQKPRRHCEWKYALIRTGKISKSRLYKTKGRSALVFEKVSDLYMQLDLEKFPLLLLCSLKTTGESFLKNKWFPLLKLALFCRAATFFQNPHAALFQFTQALNKKRVTILCTHPS